MLYYLTATNPLTTAFHWLQFDMGPLPVIFPGKLVMSVNIQILQNLTKPLIDTELYRADSSGGNVVQYPCIPGTNIGTWYSYIYNLGVSQHHIFYFMSFNQRF